MGSEPVQTGVSLVELLQAECNACPTTHSSALFRPFATYALIKSKKGTPKKEKATYRSFFYFKENAFLKKNRARFDEKMGNATSEL